MYSANDELVQFAKQIGAECLLFDDQDGLGSEIKLRVSGGCEIDAVLLLDNVFLLVEVKKTENVDTVATEIKDFFAGLPIPGANVPALKLEYPKTKKLGHKLGKASRRLDRIKEWVKKTDATYEVIVRRLFFCPHVAIDEEDLRSRRAHEEFILDKDAFQYHLAVKDRINADFMRRDFYHFLHIKMRHLRPRGGASSSNKPEKTGEFDAMELVVKEEELKLYSLPVKVREIAEFVTALRTAQKYEASGFQRMVKRHRLEALGDYLKENQTFPNNIIMAFHPDVYQKEKDFWNPETGQMVFQKELNSLILIDGQHRFLSFVRHKKMERQVLLTLLFFTGSDPDKIFVAMEKMFYNINKKQERIDPNLSFILMARIDPKSPENFWYWVFVRLMKQGFFAGRFTFQEGAIRLASDKTKSLVSVIQYGGALSLARSIKRAETTYEGIDQLFSSTKRSENIVQTANLLQNYFEIVSKVAHTQGVAKEDIGLREIGALLRIVRHFIDTDKAPLKILAKVPRASKSPDPKAKKAISKVEEVLTLIDFKAISKMDFPTSNWAAVEGVMLGQIRRKKRKFGAKQLLSKKGILAFDSPPTPTP